MQPMQTLKQMAVVPQRASNDEHPRLASAVELERFAAMLLSTVPHAPTAVWTKLNALLAKANAKSENDCSPSSTLDFELTEC
ncbi:MAG: hypothetical protein INR71_12520 [Terriglobus roseus]|nr:hypothetical protein [Terriglobus roseus]